MAKTRAMENRAIRQEALREQLSKQKHVEHVIEIAEKLTEPTIELDALMISRYKIVIDTKLKLLNKYLPDLKSVDIDMDANLSGGLSITWSKPETKT